MPGLLDPTKGLPIKEIYHDLVHPSAQAIGQTISLPFRAVNVLLSPALKLVMRGEENLTAVSQLVSEKVRNIPEEKLVAPDPCIAVPALQAISYSMDSDELRNMYTNLLAKAIISDEKSKVHPAYVEIIKQMSPLDARSLEFIQQGGRTVVALCNIRWQKKSSPSWNGFQFFRLKTNGSYLYHNFVRAHEDGTSEYDITVSFENLNRLGLIQILNDSSIDRSYYHDFENSELVNFYLRTTKLRSDAAEKEVALLPAVAEITSLGKAFSRICFI